MKRFSFYVISLCVALCTGISLSFAACTSPTLLQKWGGMTYVNWDFNTSDINTLEFEVKVNNNPGPSSDLFLQLYDGKIDGTDQYFGIQTTGRVLFSRFKTSSP